MALLLAPPGSGLRRPTFRTLKAGTSLVRLYDPSRYGTQALTFTHNGPRGRFDHHRPPPAGSGPTWDDPDRGIYYAALTLSCCLVEVFGDTRLIDRPQVHVALPTLTRDLRLLDLRGAAAMRAGTVAALSGEGDRVLTQAWSRHFYEEVSLQRCDGLIYRGAHNAEVAFALYERARDGLECPAGQAVSLAEPLLRPELLRIALRHGMDVLI